MIIRMCTRVCLCMHTWAQVPMDSRRMCTHVCLCVCAHEHSCPWTPEECVHVCVCVSVHMSTGAHGLQKRVLLSSGAGVKGVCNICGLSWCGYWEPSSGLLREQHTLNHLSIPHVFYFLKYNSYDPGWSQTHSVAENGLEPLISVSVSRGLGV